MHENTSATELKTSNDPYIANVPKRSRTQTHTYQLD